MARKVNANNTLKSRCFYHKNQIEYLAGLPSLELRGLAACYLFKYRRKVINGSEARYLADLCDLVPSRHQQFFGVADTESFIEVSEGHSELLLEKPAEIVLVEAQ